MFALFGKGEILGNKNEIPIKKKHQQNSNIVSLNNLKLENLIKPLEIKSVNDKKKLRVLFCGTYPIGQSNGYSRVVYYISKHLGIYHELQTTIYGFQNYNQTAGGDQRNEIPSNIILHDALATEDPKRHGFGEKEIGTFLKMSCLTIFLHFGSMS